MNRRGDLFVPSIVLDRTSEIPMHRQIRDQLAQAIRAGAIPGGSRLPATRVMARLLRISRNTVFTAYEELAADDLIRGERGIGMRVDARPALPRANHLGLKQVIGEARYPARILAFGDQDENQLYIRL